MITPAPIQMLWVEGKLSNLERLAMTSFVKNRHPVHLYSYGEIPNLPDGVSLFDGREILPDSERSQLSGPFGYGSWAPFSNRFRYQLIFKKGGIWCDPDIVCLRPLDFYQQDDYFFCTERQREGAQGGAVWQQVNCCAFAAPVGSQIMGDCYKAASEIDPNAHPWGETGPRLLDAKVKSHNLQVKNLKPEIFCNIDYWNFHQLFNNCHLLNGYEYCIHFWSESWRRNFLDKNESYNSLTLYERLKHHYGVSSDE